MLPPSDLLLKPLPQSNQHQNLMISRTDTGTAGSRGWTKKPRKPGKPGNQQTRKDQDLRRETKHSQTSKSGELETRKCTNGNQKLKKKPEGPRTPRKQRSPASVTFKVLALSGYVIEISDVCLILWLSKVSKMVLVDGGQSPCAGHAVQQAGSEATHPWLD